MRARRGSGKDNRQGPWLGKGGPQHSFTVGQASTMCSRPGCMYVQEQLLIQPAVCSCRESGDPSKARSYFPQDKQYLVTRGGEWPPLAAATGSAVANNLRQLVMHPTVHSDTQYPQQHMVWAATEPSCSVLALLFFYYRGLFAVGPPASISHPYTGRIHTSC